MRIESLFEGATLALDQLRANKFRSFLTILGIVVGVAVVMLMSALITGIKTSISNELEASGPRNFIVSRFDWNAVRISNDGPPWGNNPPLTIAEVAALERLPGIRRALTGVDGSGEIVFGKERLPNIQIWGRGEGWSEYTTGTFVAGHNYIKADIDAARPVAVLSRPLAEKLFGTLDPIGRQVRLSGAAFRVVGVFDMSGNIFANLARNFVFVPHTSALKYLNMNDEMLVGFIVPNSSVSQEEAMDRVTTHMRVMRGLRPSEANDFVVIRQEEMMKTFNTFTNIIFIVMIGLSSVALMVGGVGVVAIMMIAVTERTREIGVRKALGATRREILWQFLFESATVTFVGGAIGMLIGGGLAFLIKAITPLPATVPIGGLIAALLMAIVAGVFFGLWPAWRAARMDPVVALRYE